MRNRIIIVIAASLALVGCAKNPPQESPPTRPSQIPQVGISTGDEGYGRVLEIQVSNLAPTYRVASPISITVQIKNLGPRKPDSNAKSSQPTAQLFPHLTVWVEQDSKLTTERIRLPIENRIRIKQGETFKRSVDLSKVETLSSPGEYNVSIGHENNLVTDLGDWTGVLRSRSQKISIRKKE